MLSVLLALLLASSMLAEDIPVRYTEGSTRGLLALRNLDGVVLAAGELRQVVRHGQVSSRLIFQFKDGSIDDETTVYSQRSKFRLVSSHHVQRGPSFPHPIDMAVDALTGTVTVRSGDGGKEKVETQHMDLPPDVSNGMVTNILKNLRPSAGETKISMVGGGPKPRLVRLAISDEGEEPFFAAGFAHKARRYVIKVEIGGVAGAVAPLIGKAPSDIHVWMMEGVPPTMLRVESQLYASGPIWSVELTSPVWQQPKR